MADELIPAAIRNGGGGSLPAQKAPDYRQVQQEAELPQRLVDAAASAAGEAGAHRAAELGHVFKQFEGTSSGLIDKLASQSGKQAGAAAGAAGEGAPKTGLQAVTAYGQGYNSAVHATYITSSQLGLENHLTDIESKTQGDPNGFRSQATAAVEGALKAMDPLYQPEIALWAQNRIQAGTNRQTKQADIDVGNKAIATYMSATPDLITAGLHTAAALPGPQGDAVITKLVSDNQDRLDALVKSRYITPEQAVQWHQKMIADTHQQMSGQKVDISLQSILATMKTNVEAADKLIVKDDPNLTPEENASRLHEFEQDRAAYVQSQTRSHVEELSAVHTQLASGEYGPKVEGTLHDLYKAGALSEEALFAGTAESLRNQRAGIEHDSNLQLVDDVVHGKSQGPLDPTKKDQADAVDEYFQAHLAQAGAVSDQQYAVGAAEIFRQTGILPASVQSTIRVGLMSGDPVRAVTAAALAAKIKGVNPEADAFVKNPKLAALASLIQDNTKAGLPPVQAYQMAVQTTDISPEARKARDASYKVELGKHGTNTLALQNALDAATPGIFAHAPTAPRAMTIENDRLVSEFYDKTGDLVKARALAAAQLRTTWGVSSVNGAPDLMKYPIPNSMVPVVRASIATNAKEAGYAGDPADVKLTPNANTDSSGGRMWTLTHVDPKTGDSDAILGGNNRPLVYALPSGPDFAKAHQDLVDGKLAAARSLRATQRQTSIDRNKFEERLSSVYLSGRTPEDTSSTPDNPRGVVGRPGNPPAQASDTEPAR